MEHIIAGQHQKRFTKLRIVDQASSSKAHAENNPFTGIGRSLIMGVAAKAQERGWPVVRWITAGSNARARQLYDKLASATDWVTYDFDVQR